jgi:ADP-heptose:LPS heptosyltransferase
MLKMKYDRDPSVKYNVARRNRFVPFFKDHPAVEEIGFPPIGSETIHTLYWDDKSGSDTDNSPGPGLRRPFQLLAKKFGLPVPVPEDYFFPGDQSIGTTLEKFIPWNKYNILISPTSDSKKKNMNPLNWYFLVQKLTEDKDITVFQLGLQSDPYIKGAISLIGLTTPGQVMGLLRKCQLLITSDNFIMHASHYTRTPAIVLWGPTIAEVFGYPEQIHVKAKEICPFFDPCMGRNGNREISRYHEPCHLPQTQHCMENIPLDEIPEIAMKLLNQK